MAITPHPAFAGVVPRAASAGSRSRDRPGSTRPASAARWPALRESETPNTDDLAREIALANENPTRRIGVDLRSEVPGRIDATVAVAQDRSWRVGVVLHNTGTADTGQARRRPAATSPAPE